MKITLADIIEGCKQGNASMQNQLILRYSPQLFIICKRYTRDHQWAEDALQEAFINILQHIKSYNGSGNLEAWMTRIAINQSIAIYKKMNKVVLVYDNSIIDVNQETKLPEIHDRINKEYLDQLMKKLSPAQYLVFNLHVNEGLNYEEIATNLAISEHTVRATLSRARGRILEVIKEESKSSLIISNK